MDDDYDHCLDPRNRHAHKVFAGPKEYSQRKAPRCLGQSHLASFGTAVSVGAMFTGYRYSTRHLAKGRKCTRVCAPRVHPNMQMMSFWSMQAIPTIQLLLVTPLRAKLFRNCSYGSNIIILKIDAYALIYIPTKLLQPEQYSML